MPPAGEEAVTLAERGVDVFSPVPLHSTSRGAARAIRRGQADNATGKLISP
jgi:hypothetical protein